MGKTDQPETSAASMQSCHVTVMPEETVQWIMDISPGVVVDGTYGGGGHSARLLENMASPDVRVIGLDRDPTVLERSEQESTDDRLSVFLCSYEHTQRALDALQIQSIDGMLLDLGLSSDQLADRSRGFSFMHDGPLDLRFDPEIGLPVSDWLMRKRETEIANAIYQFGEERCSRRIAREIVARRRNESPVKTVFDLVDVCRRCVPRSKNHDIHPATRTFQALRIAINDELAILSRTLQTAPDWIRPGGRMAIISFHSLEDRIVKNAFRDDDRWNPLVKKPLRPSDEEVARNPRSRSAKLRIAERV